MGAGREAGLEVGWSFVIPLYTPHARLALSKALGGSDCYFLRRGEVKEPVEGSGLSFIDTSVYF